MFYVFYVLCAFDTYNKDYLLTHNLKYSLKYMK